MKKLMIALALTFAVIGGTVGVSVVTSTHVAACPPNSPNC